MKDQLSSAKGQVGQGEIAPVHHARQTREVRASVQRFRAQKMGCHDECKPENAKTCIETRCIVRSLQVAVDGCDRWLLKLLEGGLWLWPCLCLCLWL